MKIILRKDVGKLGRAGSCIKVEDGFARNYLLPRGFAFIACEGNIKKAKEEIAKTQAHVQKELSQLRQFAEKLTNISCTVVSPAIDDKKLYGSVTKNDIQKALEIDGISIDEKTIILDKPIKEIGVYEVVVRLHPEVETVIKVWVVKK